jgi:hypothetical protein
MPRVGNKHYPYTKAGVKAANEAKKAAKKAAKKPKPNKGYDK